MKKEIVIIGTGGTIAGAATSQLEMNDYVAGSLSLEEILQAVPGIEAYGPFRYIQVCNIDSSNMTFETWAMITEIIEKESQNPSVEGFLVLHGTDTMEEGAYFLHLTCHTEKPIVMTGAMRPATALSPDGPVNILQALQVCRQGSTLPPLGVIVVMNGRIMGAREISKGHTTNLDAFGSQEFGSLGNVQNGQVFLHQQSSYPHTKATPFHVTSKTQFPKVEMLHSYACMGEEVLKMYQTIALDGLILVGMGHGTLPNRIQDILEPLIEKGVVLVRASRTGRGPVTRMAIDDTFQLIEGGALSPVKLRILLCLSLLVGKDKVELAKLLHTY